MIRRADARAPHAQSGLRIRSTGPHPAAAIDKALALGQKPRPAYGWSPTLAFGRAYGGSTAVYTGTSLALTKDTFARWNVPGLDYDDLQARSRKYFAEILVDQGVEPGHRVAHTLGEQLLRLSMVVRRPEIGVRQTVGQIGGVRAYHEHPLRPVRCPVCLPTALERRR